MHTKSKTIVVLTVLVIVSLAANAVLFALHFGETARNQVDSSALPYEETVRYTMYIGTNEQDTNEPMASREAAKALVDEICIEHTASFTSMYAQGTWLSPEGAVFEEETLVYVFYGADEGVIMDIMDDVLVALDQYSILVEASTGSYALYPGR